MKKRQWLIAVVATLGILQAHADEASIRKNMAARFPGAQITSITKTPYAGLYEVLIDGQIVYSDDNADYLFMGSILDTRQRRNITQERMEKLSAISPNTLPLDHAIKMVKGDGSRILYVFSDPECPFCKRLEQELAKLNNVTIYEFPYPIDSLHPGTSKLSKQIWCAKDRNQAWHDALLKNAVPKNDGSCSNPVDENVALGNKLHVTGTPTLVFADGHRVAGAMPADKIEQLLKAATAPVGK